MYDLDGFRILLLSVHARCTRRTHKCHVNLSSFHRIHCLRVLLWAVALAKRCVRIAVRYLGPMRNLDFRWSIPTVSMVELVKETNTTTFSMRLYVDTPRFHSCPFATAVNSDSIWSVFLRSSSTCFANLSFLCKELYRLYPHRLHSSSKLPQKVYSKIAAFYLRPACTT